MLSSAYNIKNVKRIKYNLNNILQFDHLIIYRQIDKLIVKEL